MSIHLPIWETVIPQQVTAENLERATRQNAAEAMRQILVEQARRKASLKGGGGIDIPVVAKFVSR